ncbi:MAG: hypothetical protein IJ233_04055 [Pyramidobacter sp.]|nr:hypothetical protein [Pyramidobacter sp.]
MKKFLVTFVIMSFLSCASFSASKVASSNSIIKQRLRCFNDFFDGTKLVSVSSTIDKPYNSEFTLYYVFPNKINIIDEHNKIFQAWVFNVHISPYGKEPYISYSKILKKYNLQTNQEQTIYALRYNDKGDLEITDNTVRPWIPIVPYSVGEEIMFSHLYTKDEYKKAYQDYKKYEDLAKRAIQGREGNGNWRKMFKSYEYKSLK